MNRKMYEPTEKQLSKWGELGKNIDESMPSDEEIKAAWAKSHRGKTNGWGMKKRDMKLSLMISTYEYQIGIWQGRVDAANGLDYAEERNENTYNLGYHRGYTNFSSDVNGWDKTTRERFYQKYVEITDEITA